MTDNPISDLGIRALAAFVAEHRTDWDSGGVAAALRAERDSDVWQLAQRMIHRAADLKQTSPRLQPWDAPVLVGCRTHRGAPVRTDGGCGVCLADRYAVPDDAPPRPKTDPGHPFRDAVRRLQCQ